MGSDTKTFIARLESEDAQPKNFGEGGACYRFHGFEKHQLSDFVGSNGVKIFEIELDLKDVTICVCGDRECQAGPMVFIGGAALKEGEWLQIELKLDGKGNSYFYPLFSEGVSYNAEISSVNAHRSLENSCRLLQIANSLGVKVKSGPPIINLTNSRNYQYLGFYVGQGMTTCLMEKEGNGPTVFFDLGGGAPLLKQNYPGYKTNLHNVLAKDEENYLVLSHWDSDHWRILCWDQKLWETLLWFAPDTDIPDPKFQDEKIREFLSSGRLSLIDGDFSCSVSDTIKFDCFRHVHSKKANYDGVYTIIYATDGTKRSAESLMTGDLPYRKVKHHQQGRLQGDNFDNRFCSVVVPHHGDEKSAKGVPVPLGGNSIAFFSAGDHESYDHPRQSSLDAHKERFAKIIDCKDEIRKGAKSLLSSAVLL